MIVHKTITVSRPPDVAFKIFVEEITQWWPLGKYSFLGPDATITIDNRAGGRFFETASDGREYVIGKVVRYDPAARLTVTWTHEEGKGTTEIDVRFSAVETGTRIDLAHSGWETLAAGDQMSAGYSAGWEEILGLFARYADTAR